MSAFLSGRTSLTTVQAADIATGAVTTAKLGDNVVTLAKMAGGTDGNIIGIDANGDPAYIATGSDGHVLTSGGAGVASAMEAAAAGGWEMITHTTISNDASISFTGWTTGYDYKIVVWNLLPVTDGVYLHGKLGVTGPTYRSSGYLAMSSGITQEPGITRNDPSTYISVVTQAQGGAVADETSHFDLTFFEPAASGSKTAMLGNHWNHNNAGTMQAGVTGGVYTTAEAHTAFQLVASSGNLSVGESYLYRRANA